MTSTTGTLAPPAPAPSHPMVRRWLAGPRQGWSSLVLLLVMLAATGMAIDEQQWMGLGPDGTSQTGMLPVVMVAAGLAGSLLAWSRLSIGWVDLVAAIVGTAAGLLFAAAAVSDAPSTLDQLRELNRSLATFLGDTLVRGSRTQETSAFLLTVSALAWTSGVIAGLSVFRRSRALGAIVPIGAMLMLEIIAAQRPQDIWLVIFAGASLLLVLRLDLETQRDRWVRRRIGGGQGVGGLFLRGGAAVVAVMLAGSLLMATTASSTSVSTSFPQLDSFVADLAASVQGLVGTTTSGAQGTNGDFPERRPVGNSWSTGSEVVFTADLFEGVPPYWRGAAYDQYADRTWRRTGSTTQDIPEGKDLITSTLDAIEPESDVYAPVTATVTSVTMKGAQLPAPQNPVTLDHDARIRLMGEDGTFQVLELPARLPIGGQYEVTSMEPDIHGPDGLTINRLIAGGTDYDDWLKPLATVSPEVAGKRTIEEAVAVRKDLAARHRDPYRLAKGIQSLLTSDRFGYQVDIRGACRSSETVSDCLLRTGIGFCQQYATTMVMMLRSLGVPSRYVEGYLPGREVGPGQFEVDRGAAHAWVEVWFNDVGWVPFDPTPGDETLVENGQQATELLPGPDIAPTGTDDPFGPDASGADGSNEPLPSESPAESPDPDASPDPGAMGLTESGGTPSGWLLIVGAILGLGLVLGGVAVFWLRRFPGREPELAWRGVTSLATRFGVGPRPSETPYEYTVSLSKVVPTVARDLRLVADAKVAATYSGSGPVDGSLAPLRSAYRRVRAGLLRLMFRRRRP